MTTADQFELINLVVTLLTIWPCALVLKRLGLRQVAVGLLVFSIVMPLLGHMLVATYAACSRWPNFPPLVKPTPRVKL